MSRPRSDAETSRAKAFWCFISYRHDDNSCPGRQWATWLHNQIETFEVPEELVGSTNLRGERIPRRIYPVFRDEEELPAFGDLSAAIVNAIRLSINQVVICSENVRKSRFVDDEITLFKSLGKSERTYGFIISGSTVPGSANYCIPSPLAQKVNSDGKIMAERDRPLLIDARTEEGLEAWIDPQLRLEELVKEGAGRGEARKLSESAGRRLDDARISVIAAVLGVERDALSHSVSKMRRSRRMRRVFAACASVLLGAGAASYGTSLIIGANSMVREENAAIVEADMMTSQSSMAKKAAAAQTQQAEKLATERAYKDAMTFIESGRFGDAETLLSRNAEKGHAESSYRLAMLILRGQSPNPDEARAMRFLEQASAAQHAMAMRTLGERLSASPETASRRRGIELLRGAVAQGDAGSELPLALAMLATSPSESLAMLRKLSANDLLAKHALACELRKTNPAKKDAPGAPEWLVLTLQVALSIPNDREKQAVGESVVTACHALFRDGTTPLSEMPPNTLRALLTAALDSYKRDVRTSEGILAALRSPALRSIDPDAHLEACRKAAMSGLPEAMLLTAKALAPKAVGGSQEITQEAFKWLSMASKTNPTESAEISGRLHSSLMDVCPPEHRHEEQALNMFIKAAKSPDSTKSFYAEMDTAARRLKRESEILPIIGQDAANGHPDSMRLLGAHLIREGRNPEEARRLLESAIKAGDPDAALVCGDWMTLHARTPREKEECLNVYLAGAKLGSPLCAHRAASAILEKNAPSKDASSAESLLRKACEAGLAEAMSDLGDLLARRTSDERTKAEALAWLRLAQERGVDCNRRTLALERTMDLDAKALSSRLLEELRVRHPDLKAKRSAQR